MRKRKNSSSEEEEEGSEMEIEGEAKMGDQEEASDSDNDDEEMEDPEEEEEEPTDEQVTLAPAVDNPFMDSFYSLSSSNPVERAQAAQTMLQHCLLGTSANSKDAAYALRRLLNGLCSGRAAARQGNASALASFLKIAFQLEKIGEVRTEASGKANGDASSSDASSDLMYVRKRLLSATDPSEIVGRKKGSEERDYQFGRLFGILAVVRSKVLVSDKADADEVKEVASALISDLVELFWEKKWMREPAAHGVVTMLKLFFDGDDENVLFARGLVHDIVAPKLLAVTQDKEECDGGERKKLLEGYCAEQIGIAAYIQANHAKMSKKLPFPLDQAVVSTSNLPWMAQALSETSSVVHPRTHFVWDVLWCLLTEEQDGAKKSSGDISKRTLLEKIPLSSESSTSVIASIVQLVVKEKLLRMEEDSSTKRVTHERRSLALCLVKILSGVPFLSSLSGQIGIELDGDSIENILLTPEIIRAVFVNVITGGRQKQNPSLLKPMSLEVLGAMTDAAAKSGGNRQLSYAKAFLNCDARFDVHTKTSAVADFLAFSSERIPDKEDFSRWDEYLDHLETEFLSHCQKNAAGDGDSRAISYAEVLYGTAKTILRIGVDSTENLDSKVLEYKEKTARRILSFFMAAAFFDCSGMSVSSPKKKKKGKKNASSQVMAVALKLKEHGDAGGEIPFAVRSMIAARFFSLTSELAMVVAREAKDEEKDARTEKDTNILALLANLCDSWRDLESKGAKRHGTPKSSSTSEDEGESSNPEQAVAALQKTLVEVEKSAEIDIDDMLQQSKKRCCTGITVLALTLNLHRLHCGIDTSLDENPDADEEDDEEEICNALEGLQSVADDFLADEEPEDTNPLLGLAELCANILSSPIGSGSIGRGCSPKLVREAVRYAWLGGLRLASSQATENKTLLDSSVIDVLMEAVGADSRLQGDGNDHSDGMEDESASGDDSDEESGGSVSDEEGVFTKASKIMDDIENMKVDEEKGPPSDEGDSEVEIDHSKLQDMLEEDSDADVELEHHEGADAALAKLIRLRQEARKAGQQAREKIEVSNQLRCTLLLEILLGRPDAWNRLFRSTLLEMVMPLLLHRQRVATMVQKAVDGGSKVGTGEKKGLLDRLTNIIKQRLCKVRLSSMPLANAVNIDSAKELVNAIVREARKVKDKEQSACCSACLVFVLRAMPDSSETVSAVSSEYGNIVHEWSMKRSSGASLLEDLINQMPSMAQAVLIVPLNNAALESRSSFLRLEAFRLLSLLFATKENNAGDTEIQRLAESNIRSAQQEVLATILGSLKDEEMSKPKRTRVILKTIEKFLPHVSVSALPEVNSSLEALKETLENLLSDDNSSKGSGLSTATTKLVSLIDDTLKKQQEVAEVNKAAGDDRDASSSQPESKTKKSKKKKKKKR